MVCVVYVVLTCGLLLMLCVAVLLVEWYLYLNEGVSAAIWLW
jgi:hypothetical protein